MTVDEHMTGIERLKKELAAQGILNPGSVHIVLLERMSGNEPIIKQFTSLGAIVSTEGEILAILTVNDTCDSLITENTKTVDASELRHE